jgi:hypothetical protein
MVPRQSNPFAVRKSPDRRAIRFDKPTVEGVWCSAANRKSILSQCYLGEDHLFGQVSPIFAGLVAYFPLVAF